MQSLLFAFVLAAACYYYHTHNCTALAVYQEQEAAVYVDQPQTDLLAARQAEASLVVYLAQLRTTREALLVRSRPTRSIDAHIRSAEHELAAAREAEFNAIAELVKQRR